MFNVIQPASTDAISQAAHLLKEGRLVVLPTETVYGLGVDASNGQAVAEVFAVKTRPAFNPLIVHVADEVMAEHYVNFSHTARALAAEFWPGPLTLVLPRREDCGISLLVSAGLDSIALRAPAHPVAQALLHKFGRGIAAPSANRSGRVSPTLAEHAAQELGGSVAMILDGGACSIGIESTVVDCTRDAPIILRPGAVTSEDIARVLNILPTYSPRKRRENQRGGKSDKNNTYKSPGMLASHYAPDIPVRLNTKEVREGEALLAFGPKVPATNGPMLNLSESGDVVEAAANLFVMLRMLDRPESSGIAVMPIPQEGLGIAINDRLQRAAAQD